MAVHSRTSAVLVAVVLSTGLTTSTAGATARPTGPAVLHVGQIARENVSPRGSSEPDTLVEPDIAASPVDPQVAVSVFHDGRFADGGALDIGYAWTHDGGRSWRNAPVPYLTRAVGGRWPRASDPVLAFAADGTVYLSVLVFDPYACPTGVTVQRSTDGGATWSRPVLVHVSRSCTYSDDKNWIVVDQHPRSPHYGRVYQFWTPFRFTTSGHFLGAPQAVRWSDDRGAHWSTTHYVTGRTQSTQDSQPMIRADGAVVDAYVRFPSGSHDDPDHQGSRSAAAVTARGSNPVALVARSSADGGATWSGESVIAARIGGGATGVRCCLPSAVSDPVAATLYANWIGPGAGQPVLVSTSRDGRRWSRPARVDRDGSTASAQHVNSDVAAYNGRVFVSYGSRNATTATRSRYVQQKLSSSYDAGASFGSAVALGARSDLRYAAVAGGLFPGDYIGSAAAGNRLYLAWARSSRPSAGQTIRPHQSMYAATLAP